MTDPSPFRTTDAKKHGGQVVLGGGPYKEGDLKGYFLQPTIIKNMSRKMITTREETFAPVVGLYEFDTEDEAIEMANDCDVGLGSFIVTESIPRMWRVTEALEVGMVGVNLGLLSACESPFGGVKESGESLSPSLFIYGPPFLRCGRECFADLVTGYGREGGREGIQEYLTLKSMLINVAN